MYFLGLFGSMFIISKTIYLYCLKTFILIVTAFATICVLICNLIVSTFYKTGLLRYYTILLFLRKVFIKKDIHPLIFQNFRVNYIGSITKFRAHDCRTSPARASALRLRRHRSVRNES